MKELKWTVGIAAAVVALCLSMVSSGVLAAGRAHPNDVARYLAGMDPSSGSPLAELTKAPGWRTHASAMRSSWSSIDRRQLSNVRSWASRRLRKNSATMFYMFGGPDFAHADAFYGQAKTYVLSGLEPVGRVPRITTMDKNQLEVSLAKLRASFSNFNKYGYFITREMNAQFRAGRFTGTLPILYVTLARAGKTISKVEYVAINGAGKAVRSGDISGVRIVYSGRDGTPRTLYYFRTNLSNAGVAASNFLKFCKLLGPGDSLVKSASYLMHMGSFSTVRSFLLQNSATIVQDDTGIPFRFFKRDLWTLKPYGQYLGPTEQFKSAYQKDLANFFKRGGAQSVRFGIGYRWHPTRTNILVAERR